MKVFTRRPGESVTIVDRDIVVEVLRVSEEEVQLGFVSADNVVIENSEEASASSEPTSDALHDFRNRLTGICVSLHLFKTEMEQGQNEAADNTFEKLLEQVERLSDANNWSQPSESFHQTELASQDMAAITG